LVNRSLISTRQYIFFLSHLDGKYPGTIMVTPAFQRRFSFVLPLFMSSQEHLQDKQNTEGMIDEDIVDL
jgi:hypothetical protein